MIADFMRHILSMLILGYTASAADLLTEFARVESGGNPRAIGDRGRSLGALQMQRGAWIDATRRLGVRWPHSDAHDPVKCRIVAANHLVWLQGQFRAATGRNPTAADNYALWNLGLEGYRRRGFRLDFAPRATRRAARKIQP